MLVAHALEGLLAELVSKGFVTLCRGNGTRLRDDPPALPQILQHELHMPLALDALALHHPYTHAPSALQTHMPNPQQLDRVPCSLVYLLQLSIFGQTK